MTTQDNGARALAERLHDYRHDLLDRVSLPSCGRCDALAAAILANGAAFLPDAAELDRLRLTAEQQERFKWRANERAEELRSAMLRVFDLAADRPDIRDIARAALAPEGSAGSEAFTTRLAAEMATEHLLNAKAPSDG